MKYEATFNPASISVEIHDEDNSEVLNLKYPVQDIFPPTDFTAQEVADAVMVQVGIELAEDTHDLDYEKIEQSIIRAAKKEIQEGGGH